MPYTIQMETIICLKYNSVTGVVRLGKTYKTERKNLVDPRIGGVCDMKNTVIFDLDGLLINTEIISYQLYRDLTGMYDKPFSMEAYIHDYSGKTETDNMKRMIETCGLPISIEEGLAFVAAREKEYFEQGVDLKPGARELLSYLQKKQYQILLASSSTKQRAEGVLRQNGIHEYFDHMVFGAEVKRGKPFPDIFEKACEYAKQPPENCLVLEDSEAGIQAAYAAGIDVICIPDMKTPGAEFCKMAAARLSSLADVIPWLEGHTA